MVSKDLNSHQVNYNDGFMNTQRMILMADFILEMNLEDRYLQHLRKLNRSDDWSEFHTLIAETIQEYKITDQDIQQAISELVRVPVFC